MLPDFVTFKSFPGTPLKDIFIAAGTDLIHLLERLLALDPNKRCTATEALKMPYFSNKPYPSPGQELPLPASIREKPATKRKVRGKLASSGLVKRLDFSAS